MYNKEIASEAAAASAFFWIFFLAYCVGGTEKGSEAAGV